jgi:hypothetical protein
VPINNLRFTGDFPPFDVLERIPNWTAALNEEDVEGQDETTIRPADDQSRIDDSVVWTAGLVTLASGSQLPAILEILSGSIVGLTAHVDDGWAWSVRLLGVPPSWTSINFEWLPEKERPPTVSRGDRMLFPMKIESRLPGRAGTPLQVTIPAE